MTASDKPFTERNLDLVEVALESAISACQPSVFAKDKEDNLAGEYTDALKAVRDYRRTERV